MTTNKQDRVQEPFIFNSPPPTPYWNTVEELVELNRQFGEGRAGKGKGMEEGKGKGKEVASFDS